ncbi:MAG: hypothetical protein V3U80_03055 [Flavobacteriaceae bacterium]
MKTEIIISYLFHPVLFSTVGTLLFFSIQPKYLPKAFEHKIITVVFLSTYVIPVIFLFLLKKKKSIESYHLKTINERKFPIVFFFIITLLLGFRLLQLHVIDLLAYSFLAGALSLSIIFALLFLKIKTSLHTVSIGSLTGFIMVISYHFKIQLLVLLMLSFILFGIIATARLKLKAHNLQEVLLGFVIGLLSQFFIYGLFLYL